MHGLEIEAKFLFVDPDDVRERLLKAGASIKYEMRDFRRALFDYPDNRFQKNDHSKRLRVRDEGDRVAINFKSNNDTNYAHEIEVHVDSFEKTEALFEAIGFVKYTYQESKREAWELDGVEIVIDIWPWLEPYIEIEGPTEDAIKNVATKLGFEWSKAKFGSVDTAYMAQYPKMVKGDSVGDLPEVKFSMDLPQYFLERK